MKTRIISGAALLAALFAADSKAETARQWIRERIGSNTLGSQTVRSPDAPPPVVMPPNGYPGGSMSIVDSGGNGMMRREHFDIYGARERARQAMRERMQAPRHGMVERERIIVRAAAPERTRFAFFGEDIVALRGLQLENALNRLHHVNQSEIAMAKMAETKATNPQVLNYAHRVRNEHQLLDLKTRALAARRGITLANYQPATYEKALARRLNQIKRGPMFEAAFLRVMNRGNDQMVEELTMVRDDLPASSVARPLYDQALPIVTAHRDAVPSVPDRIRARLEEGDIGE